VKAERNNNVVIKVIHSPPERFLAFDAFSTMYNELKEKRVSKIVLTSRYTGNWQRTTLAWNSKRFVKMESRSLYV
jgi:hypothetical protein